MDLVDKKDRTATVRRRKESAVETRIPFGFVNHIPHLFHTTRHRTQRIERSLKLVRNDTGKGRLAHTRRTPQDETSDVTALDHLSQDRSLAHQMFLAYILVQILRTQSFC